MVWTLTYVSDIHLNLNYLLNTRKYKTFPPKTKGMDFQLSPSFIKPTRIMKAIDFMNKKIIQTIIYLYCL